MPLFIRQMEVERAAIGRLESFIVSDDALASLQNLEWRGNYRELRNFATRLAVEALDAPSITVEVVQNLTQFEIALTSETGEDSAFPSHHENLVASVEKNLVTVMLDPDTDDLDTVYVKAAATFIEHALKQSNGNLRRAARSMNTTHSTLSRILKKNKERTDYRPDSSPAFAHQAAA